MKRMIAVLAAFITGRLGMAMSFAPQSAEEAMVLN
jgi:hypothetical protein